jgi:hypothetical protein
MSMSRSGKYTVAGFMADASAILARDLPLENTKEEIADRLSLLSQRDDLTRFAMPIGPADGSTQNFLLAFEPPYSQFDPHYLSPVHEHGDFWVIGCGWRGVDRWDMYERKDDGSVEGYADLELVDQIFLPRGKTVWMPPPPRSIHSHNNETGALNMELIFTAAKPMAVEDRFYYDVEEKTCWPSLFPPANIFPGTRWPADLPGHHHAAEALSACGHERPLARMAPTETEAVPRGLLASLRNGIGTLVRQANCPSCTMIDTVARLAPQPA